MTLNLEQGIEKGIDGQEATNWFCLQAKMQVSYDGISKKKKQKQKQKVSYHGTINLSWSEFKHEASGLKLSFPFLSALDNRPLFNPNLMATASFFNYLSNTPFPCASTDNIFCFK